MLCTKHVLLVIPQSNALKGKTFIIYKIINKLITALKLDLLM